LTGTPNGETSSIIDKYTVTYLKSLSSNPAVLLQEKKVSNQSNRVSEFFDSDSETGNLLWQYVKSLSPETVTQLSKPTSPEVFQVMERNIIGLLGNLPPEHFGVTITTSRENLGRLLASAMISGYFLRNAEQRMNFETVLQGSDSNHNEAE
jgi:hypothetical protein